MTKTQHTPGPWAVPKGPFITGLHVTAPDAIAYPGTGGSMSYSPTVCKMEWSGTDEWEANARLIAAAPELLDELYTVLPYMEMAAEDPSYKAGAVRKIIDGINATIAKAEGENDTPK